MDLEKKLEEARRRGPSDALGQRVERLFAEAEMAAPPYWARPVRLWQCALACTACVLMGICLSRVLFAPEPERITREKTVYIVPMDSQTLAGLAKTPHKEETPYQVHIVPPRSGKDASL